MTTLKDLTTKQSNYAKSLSKAPYAAMGSCATSAMRGDMFYSVRRCLLKPFCPRQLLNQECLLYAIMPVGHGQACGQWDSELVP